jgi:lipoyl(octanoyl) transferase
MNAAATITRTLGLVDYEPTWRAMQRFTETRDADTPDEIWLLEHPPFSRSVSTAIRARARARRHSHHHRSRRAGDLSRTGDNPLIDLKRARLGIRDLICNLERSVTTRFRLRREDDAARRAGCVRASKSRCRDARGAAARITDSRST